MYSILTYGGIAQISAKGAKSAHFSHAVYMKCLNERLSRECFLINIRSYKHSETHRNKKTQNTKHKTNTKQKKHTKNKKPKKTHKKHKHKTNNKTTNTPKQKKC